MKCSKLCCAVIYSKFYTQRQVSDAEHFEKQFSWDMIIKNLKQIFCIHISKVSWLLTGVLKLVPSEVKLILENKFEPRNLCDLTNRKEYVKSYVFPLSA